MVKVFLQKMQIKYVGFCIVFLHVCCAFLGRTLEDKEVIKVIISGFHPISSSHQLDENLVKVLGNNCRHELIQFKRIYEDQSPTKRKSVQDQALSEENVQKVLNIIDPQIKQSLYKCVRENYVGPPISAADAKNPTADSRRQLAEAPSRSRSSSLNRKDSLPADDTFVIPIPVPKASPSHDADAEDNHNGGQTTLIIVVVVTAVVTFSFATVLFMCYGKSFDGVSGVDRNNDRPLLSLSMSNYSVGGADSSSKTWTLENSGDKEKSSNQLYSGSFIDTVGVLSSNGRASTETPAMNSAMERLSNCSGSASSSSLKPPPGRNVAPSPGFLPLKPPPGRAEPSPPPEPPTSLTTASGMGGPPPPPPPKPPVAPSPPPPPSAKAPAAPPPPPPRNGGPKPPAGPPPPPPPGKGGPRVPPLPKGGGPPRPPPFGGSISADPSKAKLKPFFWDKVMANPDHSMVWDQIKSGSFQFNEDMIESLFGYVAAENKMEKKKDSSRDSHPPPHFIQLIDQKKAQNLSILLRALSVTAEEVGDALQEGNELPPELLETLLKMAPTAEEELKLRLFDGEISQLGPAERFLKVMVDIPFAFKRIEVLLYMGTLQEDASIVKENLMTLEAACKELRSSRLFLKLLEAVLKTGNRMNDGTYRGGAQAFKLDTLLKLSDVKGTDGKTTLLHFVVQEIIRSEGVRAARALRESQSMSSIKSEDLWEDVPEESEDHFRSLGLQVVSGVGDQLQNVRRAACLDSDCVTGTIVKLGSGLVKSKSFLNKEMDEVSEDNGFHKALKAFVQHAEGDVMHLLEEEKRIMALVKSTADYFHGNSGKEEGLRLFVIVRDFLIMLEKVCREVKAKPPWPTKPPNKEPPSRQTSAETPRTPFSPDFRQRLFPAVAQRRTDSSSSDDD
ncbi:hypothetical protein RND81_12G229400 [Saponaria officinalis]|uniref:Formin-like protein n=1 Tax=Saponaria officinalis TaxID=3572 RepID=A0AAW1HE83_SAPOF